MSTVWGRTLLIAVGWLAIAVGVFGLLLHWTDSSSRPLVLLASFAPYVMIAGVVGLVLVALARHWQGIVAAGVVVGCAVWTQVPVYVANGTAGSGPQLTIMQANILFGGGDAGAVVGAVDEHSVDVLTVNELTDVGLSSLEAAGIGERLPFRFVVPAPGGAGTGIWSRYPLADPVRYDGFVLAQLSVRVTPPDGPAVTVFAFHPVPPFPGEPDRWIAEMGRVREILDAVTVERGPVLVGADFNATRDHALYRDLLRGRFEDAADQAGAGMLATYPADRWWPAVIGIDHILVAGAHAENVDTVDIPDSDHKALVATVRITD